MPFVLPCQLSYMRGEAWRSARFNCGEREAPCQQPSQSGDPCSHGLGLHGRNFRNAWHTSTSKTYQRWSCSSAKGSNPSFCPQGHLDSPRHGTAVWHGRRSQGQGSPHVRACLPHEPTPVHNTPMTGLLRADSSPDPGTGEAVAVGARLGGRCWVVLAFVWTARGVWDMDYGGVLRKLSTPL